MIRAVRSLKYDNKFGVVDVLADLMLAHWERWQHRVDLIVPIPLYPDRENKRRYNQAELLAEPFARAINVPIEAEVLGRVKATQSQAERRNREERLENISGAFGVGGSAESVLRDKNILLIDDVCTTGATLSSAAVPLLNAGAKRVTAYCLARTKGSGKERSLIINNKNQSVSTNRYQTG